MRAALRFQLIDQFGRVHVDEEVSVFDDIAEVAERHALLSGSLCDRGIGWRMVCLDPDGDFDPLVFAWWDGR